MKGSQPYEEKQLLLQIANADQASFSLLMKNHWSSVYVFALMYLKVAETAEEITQDVFVDIWNNRQKLPDLDNFRNYLFIIARNKTYSRLRKRLAVLVESNSDKIKEELYNPDAQLIYKELYNELNNAIDQLPPRRKQVFMMSRFEGLSHAAIADKLGISKQTVNEHIVEALQFLRTALRSHSGLSLLLYWLTNSFKY
ncbi:MAG: RNA polymerase sigma-70 factor [Chitinophagaceae bacterium]|nr:RNA polymerase sigma-70 factor [Chitinophagaceae bacterium]